MNGIMPDWLFITLVTAIGFPLSSFFIVGFIWVVVKVINFLLRLKK